MSSGCGDVLSLADLQTAKKHQIFEAEVITGKSGGVAGGANIDYATNQVTGQAQKTLPAVLRDVGFSPVSWDFSTGGTLTVNDRDKEVYDHVSKTWYSYAGGLPVTVPAGFNPVGNADWKPQTDPDLREELAADNSRVVISGLEAGDIVSRIEATKYAEAPDVYDVIVTYGQSNSAGEAALSGSTSGFPAPLPKSLMYDFTDGVIKPIIQNMVSSTGVASSGHAWGEFANEWYRLSGRGSVVVHCGRGAQTIQALSKGQSNNYYSRMVDGVAAAKAQMAAQGLTLGKVYFMFHQGESDMSSFTTFDTYRGLMVQLNDDVVADMGVDLFCNFTVGCPANRQEYTWATIQNAQRYCTRGRDNMVTVFDGCPSFLLRDGNIGTEGVHYTQRGYNLMGREGARGLWSKESSGITSKTVPDLEMYSKSVAPWSVAQDVNASIRWAGSTNSWALLQRSNDIGRWHPANINGIRTATDGNSLEFIVADKAPNWFNVSGSINRGLVAQGFKATAEIVTMDLDYIVKVALYCDVEFLVNTVTGEIRSMRTSSTPGWLGRNITATVVAPGVVNIKHGQSLGYAQATYYGSADGTLTAATVSVHCPDSATTRVNCSVTVNDQNPWVAVRIHNVLIKPDTLYDADATIQISGTYAPEF